VCRYAQVPQRFSHHGLVSCPQRQLQRLLQDGNGGSVVTPDNLVETAEPEQRLAFAAHVAKRPIQLGRILEQGLLAWVLLNRSRIVVTGKQEPRMQNAATRHGQISFRRVKLPVSFCQRPDVTAEDGLLVQQTGLPDSLIHADRLLYPWPG
jgi:hypothetical protein